ncbi:hypothetical protein RRG08_052455 [Elysia crispata]|uniref:Uncharacterized protein n=1 Tax=Elysia crispata TaxID=231223 RepID=A0AAE1B2T6_9GAST|nr:hypothetical protein RRG08_052455 [Elysia crispata]
MVKTANPSRLSKQAARSCYRTPTFRRSLRFSNYRVACFENGSSSLSAVPTFLKTSPQLLSGFRLRFVRESVRAATTDLERERNEAMKLESVACPELALLYA